MPRAGRASSPDRHRAGPHTADAATQVAPSDRSERPQPANARGPQPTRATHYSAYGTRGQRVSLSPRQVLGSGAHLGVRTSALCDERAAASVAARSPLIAVSGGGWPLLSVASSSRAGATT